MSTETMAERAWRYGLDAEPREVSRGVLIDVFAYPDGSRLLWSVPLSGPKCLFDAAQWRRAETAP